MAKYIAESNRLQAQRMEFHMDARQSDASAVARNRAAHLRGQFKRLKGFTVIAQVIAIA